MKRLKLRPRLSLRSMFILTSLLCCLFGTIAWFEHAEARRRAAIDFLEDRGISVFDSSPLPEWLDNFNPTAYQFKAFDVLFSLKTSYSNSGNAFLDATTRNTLMVE